MTKIIPQELYVFCAPGVLDSITVHEATLDDVDPIANLIESIGADGEMVVNNLEQFLDFGVSEVLEKKVFIC